MKKNLKKRIVALLLIGVMGTSYGIPAYASIYSASKSGSTALFSATGTISVDNVRNMATTRVTTNIPCGIEATAILRYNGGQTVPYTMQNYSTECTISAQKSNVQVVGGTGIFTVTNGGYTWSDVCYVDVK